MAEGKRQRTESTERGRSEIMEKIETDGGTEKLARVYYIEWCSVVYSARSVMYCHFTNKSDPS